MLVNIITDKETGVQYMLAAYPNMGSGLTVLIDSDGKLLKSKRLGPCMGLKGAVQ